MILTRTARKRKGKGYLTALPLNKVTEKLIFYEIHKGYVPQLEAYEHSS